MAAPPREGAPRDASGERPGLLRRSRLAVRRLLRPVEARLAAPIPADLPQAPPVTVVGSVRGSTGMGEVTRAAIAALRAVGHPTSWLDLEPLPTLASSDLPEPSDPPTGYRANLCFVNALNVRGTYPRLGRECFAGRTNVGCWSWEMTGFPAEWQGAFAPFDEIWVGSRYTQAVIAAASPVPVLRMTNLVRPATPAHRTRADLGLPADRFAFLFSFDPCSIVERKNPLAVVRAFRAAFGGDPTGRGPVLVLKMNNRDIAERRPALHGLEADTIAGIAAAVTEVGGILLDERFDRPTNSALLAACDAFVSLHRCEGFGLAMAEAMALAKPCIATGWSGNMDFMTNANSYPVACRLVTLDRDRGPYRAGDRWAEPDVEDAARWMRHVVEHREDARHRAALAAGDIARDHGPEAAGGWMVERLRLLESWRRSGVRRLAVPRGWRGPRWETRSGST